MAVHSGAHARRDECIDQVRNGNRWRVLGVDTQRDRIAAERTTDQARVIFDADYLREHITLGYAGTVHSAQGTTIGNHTQPGICWTILSDRASRAVAYVGMTRGRDENHLAIYPAVTNEAYDHQGDDAGIHQTSRGTRRAAAHALYHVVTANDDRARTMHTVVARTQRESLPDRVAALLERNDQRRARRAQAWRQHAAQTDAREASLQRLSATTYEHIARERSRSRDSGYGLEL